MVAVVEAYVVLCKYLPTLLVTRRRYIETFSLTSPSVLMPALCTVLCSIIAPMGSCSRRG